MERGPNFFVALVIPADPFEGAPPPPRPLRRLVAADLHLTLAFLGPVGEARAREAFEASQGCLAVAPPTLAPGAVLPFGHPVRYSALSFVPREESPALVALMGRVAAVALPVAGLPLERRAPRPHVTLARVPSRASPDERSAGIAWAGRLTPEGAPLTLTTAALYTRASAPGGQVFVRVAERDLGRA